MQEQETPESPLFEHTFSKVGNSYDIDLPGLTSTAKTPLVSSLRAQLNVKFNSNIRIALKALDSAYSLWIAGKTGEANAAYRTAIDEGRASGTADGREIAAIASCNLGVALEEFGMTEEANAAYRTAIDEGRASGTADGRETAAIASYNLGVNLNKAEEANAAWRTAFKEGKNSGTDDGRAIAAGAALRLGFSLEMSDKTDEANAAYHAAVELGEEEADCQLQSNHDKVDKAEEAKAELRMAIEWSKDSGSAYGSELVAKTAYHLGSNLDESGKADEANAAYSTAIGQGQASGTACGSELAAKAAYRLGANLEEAGKVKKAIVAFGNAVEEGRASGTVKGKETAARAAESLASILDGAGRGVLKHKHATTETRVQMMERILHDARQPMHFRDVFQEALALLPIDTDFTEGTVHSWLSSSGNLLLWDRGTFIHCEHVTIPVDLVHEIETWLIERLREGLPFVCVWAAFAFFKKRCLDSKVTSESALYTCLRRQSNTLLSYPRYPQIYLAEDSGSRLSLAVALEQYVFDVGSEARYEDLRGYAYRLGLKEFQFQQNLAKLANVVRTRDGFLHASFVRLDFNKLTGIVDHVREQLKAHEQVSVTKVFRDKIVTCTSLGIDSPQMLFSLLSMINSNGYEVAGFPLIRSENGDPGRAKGMISEVVEYVKNKLAPCSIDELEARFVEKLGYGERTVYAVANADGVLRYARGSLTHIDSLAWSSEKESQLDEQALSTLTQANTAGRCYALASDTLEYHCLPTLGNGISWTQTLLVEMLTRNNQFRILGSGRNAFVQLPNENSIETLEDLLCHILIADHGGATNAASFEDYLRRAGIIRKQLTPEMLGNQKKVTLVGNVIMLTKLRDNA